MAEGALLDRARAGDDDAFGQLVAPYRGELHAHCYRILGSTHDADDALQDALVGAWKGLARFEGRSSLRGWLYTVATHAALRVGSKRPKRQLSLDLAPPLETTHDLGDPIAESAWLEPYPGDLVDGLGDLDPAAAYDVRESVELAFVAALQHLPATQRAVLILRDVLTFSAAEVAIAMETSVAAVNSALQRARATLEARRGPGSQQQALRELGDDGREELVRAFIAAWERSDVEALLDLLVEDARLSMPPLPAWFDGRDRDPPVPHRADVRDPVAPGAVRRERSAGLCLLPAHSGRRLPPGRAHRGRPARRPGGRADVVPGADR